MIGSCAFYLDADLVDLVVVGEAQDIIEVRREDLLVEKRVRLEGIRGGLVCVLALLIV